MSQDPNKKSLRQFKCRDYLWQVFEQMSTELECSVDYLINESMRQYARQRNYGARGSVPPSQRPSGPPGPETNPSLGSMGAPLPNPGGSMTNPSVAVTAVARPEMATIPPRVAAGAPPAPRQTMQPSASGVGPPRTTVNLGPGSVPLPPVGPAPTGRPPTYSSPPPLPSRGAASSMPPLSVIFNGQKVPVAKEEFVIGRGSKTADLPIKDGNVSRRHAAVVFQNGAFFMKDLGSTNGVEFSGRRIESRKIEEGDVYQICDYELRFTYR